MAKPTRSGAVIYTRVSSKGQTDNYSLETQERACREYASRKGLDVLRVFVESGESAKTADRTELQAMLKYVADNARSLGAVVVYKVDRLARNALDHGILRSCFMKCGVHLQSATESLDDTPGGKFTENIFAATAQFDNEIRAERAKSGMMAAVGVGRFVWRAPIGYINGSRNEPSLVPDSPQTVALVQKAWRLVEAGVPPCRVGVQLVKEGLRLHSGIAPSPRSFRAMLRCETYTGYINAFGRRVRGDFQPLIDLDQFLRVQEALSKASHSVARPYKKVNPDFPLRGTILCPHCGQPLTASWSRGHGGKYPYYRCKHCSGVAFRKETLEPKFVSHLDRLSLKASLLSRLRREIQVGLAEDAEWGQREAQELETRLKEQRSRRDQIVEKSLKNVLPDDDARRLLTETDQVIDDIELRKRCCLEGQRVDVDVVNAGLALLGRLGSVWQQSDVADRVRLQRFVFPDGMSFDGGEFGTCVLPACLQLADRYVSSKARMARPAGVEPATCGSEVRSSIQLSYGR